MMTTSLYIFILLIIAITVDAQVYVIKSSDFDFLVRVNFHLSFEFQIGEPKQHLRAYLHPLLEDIVVIDGACGKQHIKDCPKYCFNSDFISFCDENLCGLSDQARAGLCAAPGPNSHDYNATSSTTYKPRKNSIWRRQTEGKRKLIGLYGFERVALPLLTNDSLIVENFEFVSGYSMDSRLYPGNSSVLFGIGPGQNSIVKRLYDRKIISAPLLSVAVFKQQFQIGAEDNEHCLNEWHYFPSTSKTGWEFDVDVYFSPMGWFNNTKTSIALHWPSVQIPLDALAYISSTWNLTYYFDFFVNMANCDRDFVLEYHFKNYNISVKLKDLGGWSDNSNITACGLLMQAPDYLDPFTEHSSWTIALPFFNLYCFTFNYVDNTMGITSKLKS